MDKKEPITALDNQAVLRPGLLSILIPLYNEEPYIATILQRVMEAPLPEQLDREIIVVDDGSTDDSAVITQEIAEEYPGAIRLIRQPRNRGKGAAIREALSHARGEFVIIQDADLEYSPHDYPHLLEPLLAGVADAVYGSRFASGSRRRVLYFWHTIANSFLTTACNIVSDLNLTDMETCYKAFRTSSLRSIPIRSDRFGIEPELTIKLAKRQSRIYEVPISYDGRTYLDGKKIGLMDALEAIWIICRYSFTSDLYVDDDSAILDSFSAAQRFNLWMADTIRPYRGRQVLEIGAGMGNLTRQLIRGTKRYVATDVNAEHIIRLRNVLRHIPHLETANCDLSRPEDFGPFAESMDTVVCLNVLEHIEDDLLALRNLWSVLANGGRAIILVPCDPALYGKLDSVLGHYRRYNPDHLRRRMHEAGFDVEEMLSFNRVSKPAWFLTGRVLNRTTISRRQLQLFDRFVWLWRRLDRRLPWGPTSVIAVGRKR